jgi:hypothetical protein
LGLLRIYWYPKNADILWKGMLIVEMLSMGLIYVYKSQHFSRVASTRSHLHKARTLGVQFVVVQARLTTRFD